MFDRLIVPRREAPTVSLTPGGHLCLNVDRELLVRVDDVLVRDESLTIEPMSGRGPGGNESLTGLSRVTGGGALVLSRGDGSFQPLHLRDDACFLLASAVWAFEGALLWEGGVLPGTRGPVDTQRGTIPLLRLKGSGLLVVRSSGPCVSIKVASRSPTRVRARGLLGWVGGVIPVFEPGGGFIRCEGEGALLLDLATSRSGTGPG